jgi:hypothetical protein
MAARLAVGLHGDPIRMSVEDVLVRGVGIHARGHHHAQLAAARQHLAKSVAIAEEFAAVMQRHFRGIKGHASAGAQAHGIGVNPFEIVEPEAGIIAARVVLDESQLHPPHGPVEPAFVRALPAESCAGGRERTGPDHPFAPIDFHGTGISRFLVYAESSGP